MSDEYKDRHIIIALLKTPYWYYTDNGEHHVSSLTELNKRGGELIRYHKGSPKYVVDRLLKLP